MNQTDRKEVVVITGASAGVGRATARLFARQGARIALLARGREGLEGARREVEKLGGEGLVLPTDVAQFEQVEAAAAAVEETFGPIDIWINNAMVSVFSPVKEMQAEEYRRVTEVTYLGYVHGSLAALRWMLPRNRGTIVQVGSALAFRGIPLQSAYCAAKHAIQGFTESLRAELLHDQSSIRVTEVHLPAINTPQFSWVKTRLPRKPQPVPPIYQPELAAQAIVHAARSQRRSIWMGLPTLRTVLSNRLVPGYVDRKLARTGYESQQYDGLVEPGRPHNLWQPLPGDYGTHGEFDSRAQSHSLQLWADLNRRWLALGVSGLLVSVLALLKGKKGD